MSKQLKLLTVVGARPQFIKAAVVSRAIAARGGWIVEDIVHTGQHYDHNMSDIFFDELQIPRPAINLASGGHSHGEGTARMLEGIERELMERRPDAILVYGDTNSTLAGALAASKLHIPVAHVEAGLRSYNRRMPEEVNRVLTDHVSDLLFCPSDLARGNLAREGIERGVHVVGDVMYDAVIHHSRDLAPAVGGEPFAVATIHRAENTDDVARLSGILAGLARCPIRVVLPLHPRTRKRIADCGLTLPDTVEVRDPVGYLQMLSLLKGCAFVLTDSGGLQKEAYYMGRKCLCLRDETEWRELEHIGVNRLVGTDPDAFAAGYEWIREPVGTDEQPYGAGKAGDLIVDLLLKTL